MNKLIGSWSTVIEKVATLSRLRQEVTKIERPEISLSLGSPVLSFGIPAIDTALGGGFAAGSLHEIAAASWSDLGPAIGFACALAARASDKQTTLWIKTDFATLESGMVYGPGAELFGLSWRTLLMLDVPRPLDALWAMEEALKCRALVSVIAELPNDGPLADLTATRRLALAAREGGGLGFLLRHRPSPLASSAETRWEVSCAPSRSDRFGGLGYAAFALSLVKNRRGPTSQWTIAWDHHERTFSALSFGMAQTTFDRQDRAPLARSG